MTHLCSALRYSIKNFKRTNQFASAVDLYVEPAIAISRSESANRSGANPSPGRFFGQVVTSFQLYTRWGSVSAFTSDGVSPD